MEKILYNLKLIASLKNGLLREISDIFQITCEKDKKEELKRAIARCELTGLLLAMRYGISPEDIFDYMDERIKTGIVNGDICEREFSDLSTLQKFLKE